MSIKNDNSISNLASFSPWVITAILKDGTAIDDSINFLTKINNPENRPNVKYLGLFLKNQCIGYIDVSNEDQRMILVRRVKCDINQSLQPVEDPIVTYLVGWQSTIKGSNVKTILELKPEGIIIVKNNDMR